MTLAELARDIRPDQTILLFGAGSSVPSNAPTSQAIIDHLAKRFSIPSDGFNLSEFTELIERRTGDRRRMVTEIRSLFRGIKPTAGLLNLPLYGWKSIYTTNYDNLVEQSYQKKVIPLVRFDSNFDFGISKRSLDTHFYKLHGTLEKDVSFGDQSRMIITESDYNIALDYREHLFNTLKSDLANSELIIIGNSLSDSDIKPIISKAVQLNAQASTAGRITLLMYQKDEGRADLYRAQGLKVVFGGIDEFFTEVAKKSPGPLFDYKPTDNVIEEFVGLVPTVVDVGYQIETGVADVSRMFNGWPAGYADVTAGLTFQRSVATSIMDYLNEASGFCVTLLGASGVGKTTAMRQVLIALARDGVSCWEHRDDSPLDAQAWVELAKKLKSGSRRGALFIDEAHGHVREVNELVEALATEGVTSLIVLLASTRNHWQPRIKSPYIYRSGKPFLLSKVGGDEIERLISLVDTNEELSRIVEGSFAGFSRAEKRRRLIERCESDMFVCMRNIFASESFDNIILREFTDLADVHQDIYRHVAALENAGVRVHRQLVIRILNIPMAATMAVLNNMEDIISEYTIDGKRHIYGWRGRHPVISAIIAKYKYNDPDVLVKLFEKVIDTALPTYEIEVRSLIELCNIHTGIPKFADKTVQNRLLRKIMSVVPGQRVPRHRLIRNLTDMGQYDQAETEIRIFEKDFRVDAPVTRLKIELLIARATEAKGLQREDRLAILAQAREVATAGIQRHQYSAAVFGAYCNVGVRIARLGGGRAVFEDALSKLKKASDRLGDPDIGLMIRRYERLGAALDADDLSENEVVELGYEGD